MSMPTEASVVVAPPGPQLSVWERTVRVFTRPAQAWVGLEEQVQWWFPFLIVLLISAGVLLTLFHRAYVPMILDQMEQQVVSGQLPPEKMDRMDQVFASPVAMVSFVVVQVVVVAAMTFLVALVVWFGVGFVLGAGAKFRYRHALEAVAWSGLVTLPGQLIVAGLAWSAETMKGVHIGLGALLPETETPSKLQIGLGVFLDAVSPFTVWNMVVLVLACTTLSMIPRRNVAWVLISLYLALWAIVATVSAVFSPGA